MKLETSEDERASLKNWAVMLKKYFYGDAITGSVPMSSITASRLDRLLRDIDTLLAEVGRLSAERRPFSDGLAQKVIDEQVKTIDRLTAKLAAERSAPPLPAEVEEMRGRILVALLHAAIRASNDEGHKMAAYFDSVRDEAASLLSRWPGGWRPIETAPKDGTNILLTDGTEVASGFWAEKIENAISIRPACWMVHWNIDRLGNYPTHWSPLPEPPHE